jgi:glycerophosphodiester phosphodiesterase
LHLAVRVGNVAVTQILCQAIPNQETINGYNVEQTWGHLLALAVRSEFQGILEALLLIERGINYQGKHGETAVFLAAQHGQAKMVKALVKMSAKINLSETTRAWTPLIVACVNGHQDVVDVLLQAGADIRTCDLRGWSAKDHAAFRGSLKIVEALQQQEEMTIKANIAESIPTAQNETLSSNVCAEMPAQDTQARQLDPMASHIFVHLGSPDLNRQVAAVNMEPYRAKIAPAQVPETSLFLEVSMIDSQQEPSLVQLPILDDRSNEPWHFLTDDPSRAGLSFKVFSAVNGGEQPIGSAVALLDHRQQGFEAARESLIRDYTIPVISCTNGDFLGTLTVTFVIARPFESAQKAPTSPQQLRSVESTNIAGHRGRRQDHPTPTVSMLIQM